MLKPMIGDREWKLYNETNYAGTPYIFLPGSPELKISDVSMLAAGVASIEKIPGKLNFMPTTTQQPDTCQ